MRLVWLLAGLILAVSGKAADSSVVALRNLYYASAAGSKSATVFLQTASSLQDQSNPLWKCYKGTAYILQARYFVSPFDKLSSFNKGRQLLEAAISASPGDVEMRFIRFSIQTNVPFFLGYSSQIRTDKQVILSNWKTLTDSDLKNRIRTYMLSSVYCSETEKNIFK